MVVPLVPFEDGMLGLSDDGRYAASVERLLQFRVRVPFGVVIEIQLLQRGIAGQALEDSHQSGNRKDHSVQVEAQQGGVGSQAIGQHLSILSCAACRHR